MRPITRALVRSGAVAAQWTQPSLRLRLFGVIAASMVPLAVLAACDGTGPWRVALAILLFVGGLMTAALALTTMITRPLQRLGGALATWRERGVFPVSEADHGSPELRDLETAFSQAAWQLREGEANLQTALSQHELLMQEIHHRVKNNLQIVASLLNLQAGRIKQPEARAEFQAARDRVRALATLHRHLYGQGELHTIDMRDFLEELCDQLFQAMGETRGRRITLSIEASSVQVSSDQAVPISLIVTEAVSNALKYAFPGGRGGHVAVHFLVRGDEAELIVEDDGIGLPPGRVDTETGPRDGLGLQLIRGFARQLQAVLMVDHSVGTKYTVRVRLSRERQEDSK